MYFNELWQRIINTILLSTSHSSGGPPSSLVELAGCGKRCKLSEADLIAKYLVEISNLPNAQLDALGLKGQTYVQKNHHYFELAKKYADVLG